MDEVVWRLLGAKWAPECCAGVSDLGEGPLGLASRARSLEDYKIRMFGRSEVHIGRSEVHKNRKIGRIGDCGILHALGQRPGEFI